METNCFNFYVNGTSSDERTNKWRVNCKKCNQWFEPSTTMLAVQTIKCKCGIEETINYNKLQK